MITYTSKDFKKVYSSNSIQCQKGKMMVIIKNCPVILHEQNISIGYMNFRLTIFLICSFSVICIIYDTEI